MGLSAVSTVTTTLIGIGIADKYSDRICSPSY